MQTFLVKKSYHESLKLMDNNRLVNQFEEAMHLLRVNFGLTDGYASHPAGKMWRGYEHALISYADYCLHERPRRFGNPRQKADGVSASTRLAELRGSQWPLPAFEYPPWRHDLDFYRSHRSNLIRKDPGFYGPLFPNTPRLMPYLWPIIHPDDKTQYSLYISKPDAKRIKEGVLFLPPHLEDKVVYTCP